MAGLGTILVDNGVLTPEQLDGAQQHLAEHGGSLARTLVAKELANEAQLVEAMATSIGMDYADVSGPSVDKTVACMLPAELAHALTALPVRLDADDTVVVAVAEPVADDAVRQRLQDELGLPVTFALAPRKALIEAIAAHCGASARAAAPHAAPGAAASGESGPMFPAPPPAPPPTQADQTLRSVPPVAPAPPGSRPAAPAPPGVGPAAPAPPGSRPATPRPTAAPPVASAAEVEDAMAEVAAGSSGFGGTVMREETPEIDLDELLLQLVSGGGSDLHLTAGIPPAFRVNGDLQQVPDYPVLKPDDLRKMLYAIMTQKHRERFENELELDMSYSIPGKSRFRVNVFQQRDAVGSVMRVIPYEILPLEKLGIPEQVNNFAYLPRGFVLVTGPTGSGKSTTLASILDLVNRNRPVHIMTVEDPIEFLHAHKRAVVNQREVGTDTHGFAPALKHVLRQDPDVILVGEMRDLETIQIALTAAETGHLVFGTLHTQDAPQTIDRIIDVFPPDQQEQIRVMLSGALKGVVSQTLLKTTDGKGRIAACEVMIATSGIKNLIREGKTHQVYSSIQAGAQHGMIAMDQSLAKLVKAGKVTYDAALEKANDANEFNRLVGRA